MSEPGKPFHVFDVDARRHWNDTDLIVEKGKRYRIVVPEGQEWVDWFVRCGPNGYQRWWLGPTAPLRRVPSARLLALIGAVGHDEFFEVKAEMVLRPKLDGILSFFANDVGFMYWNNRGSVEVQVTPLDSS